MLRLPLVLTMALVSNLYVTCSFFFLESSFSKFENNFSIVNREQGKTATSRIVGGSHAAIVTPLANCRYAVNSSILA